MEEQQSISPPKSNIKRIKKIALIIGIVFSVITLTGVVLAYVYENEIKRYAIDEINTHLKAKLKVDEKDVSFSFFKKFPKASLNFSDLLIEAENEKDTILFAENFSLEFGLGSLLSGDYAVNEIDLEDAVVNLLVDKKGNENYIFWKESEEEDTTTSSFEFKLKEVNFNNVALNYKNEKSKIKFNLDVKNSVFSGDFSSDTSELSITSNCYIKEISNDSTLYFQDKKGSLSIEKGMFSSDLISLSKGTINIEEMELDVNCDFDLKKENSSISAIASNVEISDVFSLMPEEVKQKLEEYKTKGKVNGSIEIESKRRDKEPRINAKFLVVDGTITEQNSGVKLSNLKLDGSYSSNSATQKVELVTGNGSLSGGEFSITGKLIGKNSQTIISTIKGNFDLKELGEFLNLEGIEEMEGALTLNNQFRGTARPNSPISVSEFTGTANLKGASLKLEGGEEKFENFSGDITFNRFNSNAVLTGNYGKSDLSINTQFANFIPYLFSDQEMKANIYIQSELLELDKLIGNTEESVSNGEDTTGVKFPERINANLRTKVAKLTYQKHELTNLTGSVLISKNQVKTSDLIFNSNGGRYSLSGQLSKTKDGFNLTSKIVCGQIQISDLLLRFDNFGQEILRHDHLTGTANALINLKANTTKHLELDMNSLEANTEFSISGGVLKDLELFDEIGDYLKENVISRSIVKVDELSKKLRRVEFSEFTNTINIKNRTITIPSMMIKTSAMDIGIYGNQTFDYDINYGMSVRLKDILTKKKDTEYGYIVDDGEGARLFLLMTGTIDEPVFKLDKQGRKDYQQKQREAEKNNVKSILKDEFGLFGKDSTVTKTSTKEKPKPKFEVEWEEEEKEKTQSKKEEKEPEKKKKKNKWLEKLKGKEEKKDKVGFEVE